MKKYHLSLLFCLLLHTSCFKSDTGIVTAPYAGMTTRVNGVQWSAIKVTGNIIIAGGDTAVIIAGEAANGQKIQLNFSSYPIAPGIYYVDGSKPAASAYFYKTSSLHFTANQGQIIIENISSDSVRGVFNLKTTDSEMIDQGNFTVILVH